FSDKFCTIYLKLKIWFCGCFPSKSSDCSLLCEFQFHIRASKQKQKMVTFEKQCNIEHPKGLIWCFLSCSDPNAKYLLILADYTIPQNTVRIQKNGQKLKLSRS